MTETPPRKNPLLGWALLAGAALVVFLLGMLASSINERRTESAQARVQFMQPLDQWESDPKKWGVSFPREYNSWESTKKTQPNTVYGGSGERDYLAEHPNLVVMWAGYPFAKQYKQARGHFHALEDVTATKRRSSKTPATCLTCKSPDVPRLMARDGVAQFYAQKFDHYVGEAKSPIACLDCHDPKTMALRISRPGLKEAFERQGKDLSKATHQEMRSLVCAQCHVEYYFKGKKENYLTFPWDKGMTPEAFEQYYAGTDHVDFVHAISGAKMIKMQHPDYELFQQGIHAFRNVACADCHMPYTSEGGIKYTDHGVRSPLYNVAASCQVCHRWSETEVRTRVTDIQNRTREVMERAERAITAAHLEIGDAMRLGAPDSELEGVRKQVSLAQMYWDYVAAANGMGFHAPQESVRILGKALDLAQECRLETGRIRARHGSLGPLEMPDLSTRDKAQAYIQPFVEAQAPAAAASPASPAEPAAPASPAP